MQGKVCKPTAARGSRQSDADLPKDDGCAEHLSTQRDTQSKRLIRGFGPLPDHAEPVTSLEAHLLDPLTRKETRVLTLLAEGYSNSAMAEKLFISDSTVRTHLRNINAKLGANSRTQAVAIARKLGLVQ